jgi:hypothetical protein
MSVHSRRADTGQVANLVQRGSSATTNRTVSDAQDEPPPGRDAGDLAVEMRSMVTPVIGYLELISQDGEPMSADRHLPWIDTIERRLEAIQELNDQIARTCAILRESVNGREAGPPRAPEAPGD